MMSGPKPRLIAQCADVADAMAGGAFRPQAQFIGFDSRRRT